MTETVAELLDLIASHRLDARALGHAAWLLADLEDVLVDDINPVLRHIGDQLGVLEYATFGVYCPTCGKKGA